LKERKVGLTFSRLGFKVPTWSFRVVPFASDVATIWVTSFGGGFLRVTNLHPPHVLLFYIRSYLMMDADSDMADTFDSTESTLAPLVAHLSSIDAFHLVSAIKHMLARLSLSFLLVFKPT
jgi:hypothetical protein